MHLFISSHPGILISSCSCVLACILTSLHHHIFSSYALAYIPVFSYPQVCVCLLVSLHPHILISSGSYVLACIFASLHPHILRFMCACLYPCILTVLTFSGSCVFACILASSHPHILRFMCACWYPRILTSSYPQVCLCLLVCSHLHVNVFSIRMNNCILASLSSLVLGNL